MSRTVPDSKPAEIIGKVEKLRASFDTGKTLSYEWRHAQLKALLCMCKENETVIAKALNEDLGRGQFEAIALELVPVYMEIEHALGALAQWMKPVPCATPLGMCPSMSEVHNVPFGVALIISPFNYPMSLCFGPLVGAIAAGNTCLIKPSEMTPSCEAVISQILPKYMDTDCIDVIFGGIEPTKCVLAQHFDKIFFTGSTRVGKIVMKAAAENLTNITMELGGKSPCIVDKSCTNMDLAVKRILWGKFCNSGQTCIAPDYMLVHEDVYEEFMDAANARLLAAYGEDPSASPDYCRLVTEMHCKRMESLSSQALAAGATIGNTASAAGTPNPSKETSPKGRGKSPARKPLPAAAGSVDVRVSERYCAPTFLTGITTKNWDKFDVMKEEIFGPLLPIIKCSAKDFENIPAIVNKIHKHPLALYIFSKNRTQVDNIMKHAPSGGAVSNDVVYHFANGNLPFGGIGPSGMGCCHGEHNFACFSHNKAVMRRDDHTILDIPQRYPPYNDFSLTLFRLNAKLPNMPYISNRFFKTTVALGVVAFAVYEAFLLKWL